MEAAPAELTPGYFLPILIVRNPWPAVLMQNQDAGKQFMGKNRRLGRNRSALR